jgi:hypothetical protein
MQKILALFNLSIPLDDSLSKEFRFIFIVSMYEPVLYHAVSFHENVFVVVVIH